MLNLRSLLMDATAVDLKGLLMRFPPSTNLADPEIFSMLTKDRCKLIPMEFLSLERECHEGDTTVFMQVIGFTPAPLAGFGSGGSQDMNAEAFHLYIKEPDMNVFCISSGVHEETSFLIERSEGFHVISNLPPNFEAFFMNFSEMMYRMRMFLKKN